MHSPQYLAHIKVEGKCPWRVEFKMQITKLSMWVQSYFLPMIKCAGKLQNEMHLTIGITSDFCYILR